MTDIPNWSNDQLREFKAERDQFMAQVSTLDHQLERVGKMLDEIETAAERNDLAAVTHWVEEANRRLQG